jgi:hypothetical protein
MYVCWGLKFGSGQQLVADFIMLLYLLISCVVGTIFMGVEVMSHYTGSVPREAALPTTMDLVNILDQLGEVRPVSCEGRRYVLTSTWSVYAYQAIYDYRG